MQQNRIDNYMAKKEIDPKHRIPRNGGGQYLKNFLLEFAKFVRDETLIEVQRDIKKLRNE